MFRVPYTKFLTDSNTRTVLSSFYTNVNDYYHYKVPTLLDSPIHWLTKSIKNALNSSMGFLKALILLLPFALLFLFHLWQTRSNIIDVGLKKTKSFNSLMGLLLIFFVQIICIFLTGYDDSRYYSAALLTLLFFLLSILIPSISISKLGQNHLIKIALPLCFLISSILIVKPILKISRDYSKHRLVFNHYNLSNSYTDKIKSTILASESNPKILFMTASFDPVNPHRFGAMTGLTTFPKPRNLTNENFEDFINHYEINIIFIDETTSTDTVLPDFQTKEILRQDGYKILSIHSQRLQ